MAIPSIVASLQQSLPAAPGPSPTELLAGWAGMRLGAVLVLLHRYPGGVYFPVIERPPTLRHHPGQIALPGGAVEPGDGDAWLAALRETREELGIDTAGVSPVGRLEPLPVSVSGFLIAPFVGWLDATPVWAPDPGEVAGVTEIALDAILDHDSVREEVRALRLGPRIVTYYDIDGLQVWGATARILADLARHLGAAEREYPPGWVREVST